MATNVKVDVKYYVKIPGNYIYLKDEDGNGAVFTKFQSIAKDYDEAKALKLAEEYNCEILVETTTTTTETTEKIIPREVINNDR